MEQFHIRLIEAMKLRDMSQKMLCERTGIPKSAMSQYISGAFKPKQERTYLIAKALNVSVVWLLGHDVPMDYEGFVIDYSTIDDEDLKNYIWQHFPEHSKQDVLDIIHSLEKLNNLGIAEIKKRANELERLTEYSCPEEE